MKKGTVIVLAASGLFLGGCNQPQPAGDVARGPGGPSAIEVTIEDGAFQPNVIQVPSGDVTIEITNLDHSPHDFALPSLDVNTGVLEEGDVATADLALRQHTVEFVCTLHDGMKGTITRNL